MSSDEESPHLSREKFTAERSPIERKSDSLEPINESFFGPMLPPHLLGESKTTSENPKIIGPIMPSYISQKPKDQQDCEPKPDEKTIIGPEIPNSLMNQLSETKMDETPSDDDNDFGPSPNLMASTDTSSYYSCIGERKIKEKDTDKSITKRETWMLELPEEKAAKFGLGPRQFKTRVPTDKERDSSVWTDTPADKERKQRQPKEKDHKQELKIKRLKERDKEMEKLAKKAAKKAKKEKSLMEIHLKNMKKKKKKEAKKDKAIPERRPFDRNIDLQVHRFDESQKRAFLNKTRFLNDRFASGENHEDLQKTSGKPRRLSQLMNPGRKK